MGSIIETERLLLRKLEIGDAEKLALVLSDKESMKHYPHPFSKDEVIDWIHWNLNNYEKYGFGLWAVIRKGDMEFLGDCGITMQTIDGQILPEIGFHIIGRFCKNGYASEAAFSCLDYVAMKYGFKDIFAYCEEHNAPSVKVMKKIGMKKEKEYEEDGVKKVVFVKSWF